MNENLLSPDKSDEIQQLKQGSDKPARRSCLSTICALFYSAGFVLSGLIVAFALFLLRAPRDEVLIAAGFFLFAFIMQWRASRVGCFRPMFIFIIYLLLETGLIGVIMFQTGAWRNINFDKLQQTLRRELPQLHQFGTRALETTAEKSKMMFGTALDAAKKAVEGFRSENKDQRLAELEAEFQENPGDESAVLALANAYLEKGDLFSIQLAVALFKALSETDPADLYFERLALCHMKMFRYDLAFSTAARRIWLPYGNAGLIARQIALIAVNSGDLARGIVELEKMQMLAPVEISEVRLYLASLHEDSGNHDRARALAEIILAEEPADEPVAQQAASLMQKIGAK